MTTLDRELSPEVDERLRLYRNLLLAWNHRFNLTAITEPGEIDRRLIGDALCMLPALDDAIASWEVEKRRVTDSAIPARAPRLIDVGSGAGLPGLVLKVARPQLDLTLVEATGKKVNFLNHAIAELGLENARAIHARAEEIGRLAHHRERYDIVTARAVAAMPVLMELCAPLMRIGGHMLCPKGIDIDEELAAGERAGKLVGVRIVSHETLPAGEGDNVTRLVVEVKIESTPVRFPRRPGIPAKEPLGRIDQ